MKYLTKLIFVFSVTWLNIIVFTAHAGDVSAPPHTPRHHQKNAANYVLQRARILEEVDQMLKSTRPIGESSYQAKADKVKSLRRLAGSYVTEIKADLDTGFIKAESDEKLTAQQIDALKELIKIYDENSSQVVGAYKRVLDLAKFHDFVLTEVDNFDAAVRSSNARRRKITGYLTILTTAMKYAQESRVAALIDGSAQQGLTLINGAIEATEAKAAVVELVSNAIGGERRWISSLLSAQNPDKLLRGWSKASTGGRLSASWNTYAKRWGDSVKVHLSTHERAYNNFKKRVDTPWTNLYEAYPMATLSYYENEIKLLTQRQDEAEEALDDEQKAAEAEKKAKESAVSAAESAIEDLENQKASIERSLKVIEEQQEDLEEGSKEYKSLEKELVDLIKEDLVIDDEIEKHQDVLDKNK